MDKDLQTYYDNRFEMTGSKGWVDFLEEANKIKEIVNSVETCKSDKDLYLRQGQINILNWIINLRDQATMAYENLKNESL